MNVMRVAAGLLVLLNLGVGPALPNVSAPEVGSAHLAGAGTSPTVLAEQADGSGADSRGPWLWPTGQPVPVVRHFDPPALPWLSGHRGVDLQVAVGSELRSPAPGTVVFAGKVVDRQVVSVMHSGGLRTTYEPVIPLVSQGDQVAAGTPIATLEPGHAPGDFHWGARFEKNEYVNPLRFLLGPVVLKPWGG